MAIATEKLFTLFANDRSNHSVTPAGLKRERRGTYLTQIGKVRIEIGWENGEDAVAAAEEWSYHGVPVVVTPREYDREPMFGQEDDQGSMFGLPPELAYHFAKSEDGSFRWCATPRLLRLIAKFFRCRRLVRVTDAAAVLV